MRKTNKTETTAQNNKVFNACDLQFDKLENIIKNKEVKDSCTKYPLLEGVTLTIYDTDKDYDFGSLCVFGLNVNVTFRPSKKGVMFVSYPSTQTKKGEWKDLVMNYSESMRAIIDEVVTEHYKN